MTPPAPRSNAAIAENVEYHVTFQSPARSAVDPRGTIELTGPNFPDLCTEAARMGYPRAISGEMRYITDWTPIDYPWDEATP